ncbi:MAG: hypothetical protein KAR06_04770 [Deltaproteobacteria bacterium]|nr:hypothetical protein [Deltaproteobacteria bacterium]
MKSNWRLKTNVKVTVRDLEGRITDVQEFHNLITTVGLGMIIDFLWGDVADGEIKYMALGDDNTAPALGDTTLGNETFRKAMTTQAEGSVTSLVSTVYVAPAENTVQIEEIGWFAGAAAGAGADSGIMVSRILYSRLKTALESLQIERTDTVVEG